MRNTVEITACQVLKAAWQHSAVSWKVAHHDYCSIRCQNRFLGFFCISSFMV